MWTHPQESRGQGENTTLTQINTSTNIRKRFISPGGTLRRTDVHYHGLVKKTKKTLSHRAGTRPGFIALSHGPKTA